MMVTYYEFIPKAVNTSSLYPPQLSFTVCISCLFTDRAVQTGKCFDLTSDDLQWLTSNLAPSTYVD